MEKRIIASPTTTFHLHWSIAQFGKNLSDFRLTDALIFTGIPVLGMFLSIYHSGISAFSFWKSAIYTFAIFLLALHVFLINDWADYRSDKNDEDKSRNHGVFSRISPATLLFIASLAGIGSLALLLLFSVNSVLFGAVIVVFSLVYSTSYFFFHGKSLPILSSLLHVSGGMLAFALGYILYGEIRLSVWIAGLMPGVFLSGGHLFQEIQDIRGDWANRTKTTASLVGIKSAAILGLSLLFLGHTLLQYLISEHFFPDITLINWLVFLITAILIVVAINKGLSNGDTWKLRIRYRIVFALFGIYIFIKIFINLQ